MSNTPKQKLKELRKAAGLTQHAAALAFGVSVDTIKRWEDGKTYPTVPQIYKIEAAYNTTFAAVDFGV